MDIDFRIFVEDLYLAYLRRHIAWGGPARIPSQTRAWTPSLAASITPAASHAFLAQVEDAARATPLEGKRGGITYADEVRHLHDALATEAACANGGPRPGAVATVLAVQRVGVFPRIDLVRPGSSGLAEAPAGAKPTGSGAAGAPVLSRREALRGVALLSAPFARVESSPAGNGAGTSQEVPADVAREPIARIAGILRDLNRLPWRDRYPWRPAPEGGGFVPYDPDRSVEARLRELGAGSFVTPGALARQLAATFTDDADGFTRAACARDLAHAERADHVWFHVSTTDRLLARLRPLAERGTHWAGPHAGGGWSWDGLVSCAMFDLRNFAASLRLREDCIAAAGDPLTFENELQVALDPFLLRRENGSRLIGPVLCARAAAGVGIPEPRAGGAPSALPVTYVWLLEDGLADDLR